MPIIGRREDKRMERPQPKTEIHVEQNQKAIDHLHIWAVTPDARQWLEQEVGEHCYGALYPPYRIGGAYLLIVSPVYEPEQVAAWISNQGQDKEEGAGILDDALPEEEAAA